MHETSDLERGVSLRAPFSGLRWRLGLGVLASLFLFTASAAAAGDARALELTVTTRSGEILVSATLPADGTWHIEWIHSVAQVRIIDVYAYREGKIYITDQYTPYLDIAGLGAFAGRGSVVQLADGSYHLSRIDFPLHGNTHDLIIGSALAPSVLVIGDRRFELSETHPATHARIEVRQL